jgi:hypothetical protein
MMKDGLRMREVDMSEKEGLVCRGWVSLVISHLRNELSTAAFVVRTVALHLKEHPDDHPVVHRSTLGYW